MRVPRRLDALAGRNRSRLSADTWSALRTVRSAVGTGPLVGLPALRRALVVAPHPDDEVLGCGGTLVLLAAAGCDVRVVVASDGGATPGTGLRRDELVARRAEESRAACRVLGVGPPTLLGLPDGGLVDHLDELVTALDLRLRRQQPDAVLVPWAGDDHPDHRAALTAVLRCSGLLTDCAVWGYETWTPVLRPDRVVDITSVAAVKDRALAEHRTAALSMDLGAMLALDRYRSVHGLAGRGRGEAFSVLDPQDHQALLTALEPARTGGRDR